MAQDIADRIFDALREATSIDEKWAPQLRQLMADDDLTVSAADWDDALKDMQGVDKDSTSYLGRLKPPPKNGRPQDNADWWKSLSPQERADYLAAYPGRIGALDGLPAIVRDDANRTVLAETRGDYQTQLDSVPPPPKEVWADIADPSGRGVHTPEWTAWNALYGDKYRDMAHIRGRLNGMNAIQNRFDATGTDGLPEAYLLGFDPEGRGDGKVILANGNPDTADHTAIYVPGTTSKLDKIGGDINRGVSLWQASHQMDPTARVSTITWFDYNAPDNIPAATSDSYAHSGASELRNFLDGNTAAHQAATGNHAHTTLIGHSYGSTLIGDTAKFDPDNDLRTPDPLPVDDVIAVGSPGMQAQHPGDLGIDPTHMWAEGGGGLDHLVRDGGRLVGLGGGGNIPTDPAFGGNVMKSDADTRGSERYARRVRLRAAGPCRQCGQRRDRPTVECRTRRDAGQGPDNRGRSAGVAVGRRQGPRRLSQHHAPVVPVRSGQRRAGAGNGIARRTPAGTRLDGGAERSRLKPEQEPGGPRHPHGDTLPTPSPLAEGARRP